MLPPATLFGSISRRRSARMHNSNPWSCWPPTAILLLASRTSDKRDARLPKQSQMRSDRAALDASCRLSRIQGGASERLFARQMDSLRGRFTRKDAVQYIAAFARALAVASAQSKHKLMGDDSVADT